MRDIFTPRSSRRPKPRRRSPRPPRPVRRPSASVFTDRVLVPPPAGTGWRLTIPSRAVTGMFHEIAPSVAASSSDPGSVVSTIFPPLRSSETI